MTTPRRLLASAFVATALAAAPASGQQAAPQPLAPHPPPATFTGAVAPPTLQLQVQSDGDENAFSRYVGWGLVIGAGAGLVSGLVVLNGCGYFCDSTGPAGIAVYAGTGALLGGVIGGVAYALRR